MNFRRAHFQRIFVSLFLCFYLLASGCARTTTTAAVRRKDQSQLAFIVQTIMLTFAVTACGSNSGSGSAATVTGVATLGPAAGATVNIYQMNADGTLPKTPIATTTTDATGNYTLGLPALPTSTLVVQFVNGISKDETTGVESTPTVPVSAAIPDTSVTSGATVTATLSPLTDIAVQRLTTQMGAGLPAGTTPAQACTNVNYSVSQAVGLPDILGTSPAAPTGNIPSTSAGQYTLVLAALSKTAAAAGVDIVAMGNAYAKSFKDTGVFNPSGAVTVTDFSGASKTFTPPAFSQVATYMSGIQNGTVAMPGMAGATIPSSASMQLPKFNPMPPTTAPSTYVAGQTVADPASAAPTTSTSVSCTASSVIGSCTMTMGSGPTALKSCSDFVTGGTMTSYAQITANCSGTGMTPSSSACTKDGYVSGYRMGSEKGDIMRFYSNGGMAGGGFDASQNAGQQFPCTSGT